MMCPEFPLSELALTGALEETDLSWSIEQMEKTTDEKTTGITYSLHRPESGVDYNTVFVTSFDSGEIGRRLQILYSAPQKKQWWDEEVHWEDWKKTIELTARLYGGFEDAEEIYRACSAVELPQEKRILWQGMLTGGYCVIRISEPIQSWRFSRRGYTLSFNVFESEDTYLQFQQLAEKARKH